MLSPDLISLFLVVNMIIDPLSIKELGGVKSEISLAFEDAFQLDW